MDVALRTPVPVGLVRSVMRPGSFALVVKTTYSTGTGPQARLVTSHEALREQLVEGSRIYAPSDFAESKQACDVALVGPGLRAKGAVWLRVGAVECHAQQALDLGPFHPTDPPSCSFAPPTRRMPFPSLPLSVEMSSSSGTLAMTLPAPKPSAALVFREAWSAATPLDLYIDGILLDPVRALVEITLRGYFQHAGDVDREVIVLCDAHDQVLAAPVAERMAWPRKAAVEPGARAFESFRPAARTVVVGNRAGGTVPNLPAFGSALFGGADSQPPARSKSSTVAFSPHRQAPALPFATPQPPQSTVPEPPSAAGAPADPAHGLRAGETLVQKGALAPNVALPRWLGEAGVGRPSARPPSKEATPFEPASAPGPVAAPVPAPAPRAAPVPAVQLPAPAPPAAVPMVAPMPVVARAPLEQPSFIRAAAVEKHPGVAGHAEVEPIGGDRPVLIEGLSLEAYCAIRSALWSAGEDRPQELRRHRLTELKWRLIERRWAQHLATLPPDRLPQILGGLQAAKRAASFADEATSEDGVLRASALARTR